MRSRSWPAALLAAGACSGSSSSSTGFGFLGVAQPGQTVAIQLERLTVSIPAGAVNEPVHVQGLKTSPFLATGRRVGSAYALGPAELTFNAAATVTVRYANLALPAGVVESDLVLAEIGPSGIPKPLAGSTVDAVADEVSAPLPSLGTIALVAPSGPPPDNGSGSIVFLVDGLEGLPDLWIAAADASSASLVTAHTPGETMSGPRASAGAALLAFTETAGGFPSFRAWIVNPDGSGRTLVTSDNGREIVGDLRPSGTGLFVARTEPDAASADLAVRDLTQPGFPLVALTATPMRSERDPRVSPDGTTLVFLDEASNAFSRPSAPGGSEKAVTKVPVVSVAWRPDGERLAVERPAALGGGIAQIVTDKTQASLPAPLKGSIGARRPTYSSNGAQVIFELLDTDPTVLGPDLRQIPVAGAPGSILLGGSATVLLGRSPHAVP